MRRHDLFDAQERGAGQRAEPTGSTADRFQAAEELGLLAAGMLEEAEATNRDGAVLAVDQSKAYDRVPLDLLEELLRDSGVHPAIGGRCYAWQGANGELRS